MTDWGQSDATAGEVVSIAGAAYVFYDAEVRNGGSLSWCNCNPGNIVTSGEAERYSAYPGAHNYRFAVFPDEGTGQQAGPPIFCSPPPRAAARATHRPRARS